MSEMSSDFKYMAYPLDYELCTVSVASLKLPATTLLLMLILLHEHNDLTHWTMQ